MTETDDPLSDALATLLEHGLDPDRCRRAIAEVRRRWGGSEVYIRAVDREARDEVIRAALAEGLPTNEIARRVGVHPATIRRKRSTWL
jgi:DNA-binding NarL/FixJ family response regulator